MWNFCCLPRRAFVRNVKKKGESSRSSGARSVLAYGSRETTKGSYEPKYVLLKESTGYELRLYDPFLCIETEYESRNEGIAALSSYLDGDNEDQVSFAFTQPLIMSHHEDRKLMKVYLCDARGSPTNNPPLPNKTRLRIAVEGGSLLAIRRFDGNATKERVEGLLKELLDSIQADDLSVMRGQGQEKYHVAQYGTFYSLKPRTNELWLRVQP